MPTVAALSHRRSVKQLMRLGRFHNRRRNAFRNACNIVLTVVVAIALENHLAVYGSAADASQPGVPEPSTFHQNL